MSKSSLANQRFSVCGCMLFALKRSWAEGHRLWHKTYVLTSTGSQRRGTGAGGCLPAAHRSQFRAQAIVWPRDNHANCGMRLIVKQWMACSLRGKKKSGLGWKMINKNFSVGHFRLSRQFECAEWVASELSQWGWSGTGITFIPHGGGGVNELEDISWNKAMQSFWVIRMHWMGKASCFLGHRSGVMILTMDAGKLLVIKFAFDFSGKSCLSLLSPAAKKIAVN